MPRGSQKWESLIQWDLFLGVWEQLEWSVPVVCPLALTSLAHPSELSQWNFQAHRCPGTGCLPAATPSTMSIPHDCNPRGKGSDGNWAFSTCLCPFIREESFQDALTNFPLHPTGQTGFYGQWELQRRLESEI